ncbi:MFS transporter [Terriglobus sp.]|uniref:MFS transporter n=1 Tax=Terriglobus sp. TaxID=1889013 RepID=UPI003B004587
MSISAARRPLALYVLFGLTGVGLVLPGTLLPFLARRWGWQDGRSGLLFFLFFVGTTVGAFCARGMLGRMLLLAGFAVAAPLAWLPILHGPTIFAAVVLNGFGLGLTMTAVTLLRSRQVRGERVTELARLNLLWALGAACAPFLLLRSAASVGLTATLRSYAAVILLCAMAAALPLWSEDVPTEGTWAAWRRVRALPALFAISLPLATGIEAGVGAWLVTYASRDGAAHHAVITAGSALWAGLLLSRLLFSGRRFRLPQSRFTGAAFAGLLVCGLLLLFSGNAAPAIVAGAFCAGFGIGPVYPQLLALLLSSSEAGNAGFLLAGAGSALLPLLIGQVSQHTHSLRLGLLVPLLASVVLLLSLLYAAQIAGKRSRLG